MRGHSLVELTEHDNSDVDIIVLYLHIRTAAFIVHNLYRYRMDAAAELGRNPVIKVRFKRFKFPNFQQSQRCVLPKKFQTFGIYRGPNNLESLASKFWSPFQICVAPAHKGDIRTSYVVPLAALNSRASLDIGWAMAGCRKRVAPCGSAFGGCIALTNTRSTN